MELDVAVVFSIATGFLSIIGYKVFKQWNSTEAEKVKMEDRIDTIKMHSKQRIAELENSNRNYIYKMRKYRENYDLQFDDEELQEMPSEDEEDFNLSDLAKVVYPKIPPAVSKLIDKEEFQNAILKTMEKKPDLITNFIDKYMNKTEKSSDQGSTNKLQETYQ